jgi:CPA1 family monovalent cation:H+ antiporter
LIYRAAVGAVRNHEMALGDAAPTFLLAVAGSVIVGPALGWVTMRGLSGIRHTPTQIILQFVTTFGVWLLAEGIGLSGVLTMVAYAMYVAQGAPARTPARARIPTYAVWETVVFALNILAFIFIGLQVRPILGTLKPGQFGEYLVVAIAVLITCILVRFLWHMSFNSGLRLYHRRFGYHPKRPMLRPTFGSGFVISWSGMRGIVSLAAALGLPAAFPYRDLIVLTAFSVVLGTLVIQGLTLKPLLRWLDLKDGDPVGQEVSAARDRALRAALASFDGDRSPAADAVRKELTAHFQSHAEQQEASTHSPHADIHLTALEAARRVVHQMRASQEIGDDAFHLIEEELDWLEMASPSGHER